MIERSQEISVSPQFRLDGKVALITAAGSGMGRACALGFAAAGAIVYAVDLVEAGVGEAADEARARGLDGSIIPVVLDATNDAMLDDLLGQIEREQGRIDVLFNHAGRACKPGLDELTNEDWLAGVDLNLRVPIILTSKALPLVRKSSSPSIIFTASIAGLVASPNSPLYSAVKGAVIQFSKSVAAALGPEGIRSNAICPGTMETPMLVDFFRGTTADPSAATRSDVDPAIDRFKQQVPLGRTGVPSDVVGLAIFLASDASAYVTGTAIPVDGGYVAK